jgi:hypothetical protein
MKGAKGERDGEDGDGDHSSKRKIRHIREWDKTNATHAVCKNNVD